MPCSSSPKDKTLTKSAPSGIAADHSSTPGDGFGLVNSDNAHVSIRYAMPVSELDFAPRVLRPGRVETALEPRRASQHVDQPPAAT